MSKNYPEDTNTVLDAGGRNPASRVYLFSCNTEHNRFQTDLVTYYFTQKFNGRCTVLDDPAKLPDSLDSDPAGQRLILFDCHGMERNRCQKVFQAKSRFLSENDIVVLLNIGVKTGIDKEALRHGVRGVFYAHDSISTLEKGLKAMLQGDIWFPRKVVTEYFLNKGRKQNKSRRSDRTGGLTARETEILALITFGASNQDIADKLNISPHTIKTHIYNIFKKIKTPNRLQAALWASKNLQ